jgi:hypothetical protein
MSNIKSSATLQHDPMDGIGAVQPPKLKLEFSNLREFGERTEVEDKLFQLILSTDSLEKLEIGVQNFFKNPIDADFGILECLALEAAILDGSFDKFKFVWDKIVSSSYNLVNQISHIISSAEEFGMQEDLLLDRLEYAMDFNFFSDVQRTNEEDVTSIVQEKINSGEFISIFTDDYTVSLAVNAGFYKVGEFLLAYGASMKELDKDSLFRLYDNKNVFDSFEWMYKHGAAISNKLVGSIIYHPHDPWKFMRNKNFDVEENRKAALDFLIKQGITTEEKIAELLQNMDILNAIHTFSSLRYSINVNNYLEIRKPIKDIKLLVENGAKFDIAIFAKLIN